MSKRENWIFEYKVNVYYKGMAHFPLMVALSITQAENISVHAELFICFILYIVLKRLNYELCTISQEYCALKAASDTNLEEACKCACMHIHPPIHPHTQQYFLICAMQLFCISYITLFCLLASKGSLENNKLPSILLCLSSQTTASLFLFFPLYEIGYSSCSFVQYLLPKTSEIEW